MLKTIAAFDRIGEENAFAVLARANALAAQGRDIISLGIGQPDFRTPDHIAEAAIQAIKDGHHGYTAATGIPVLSFNLEGTAVGNIASQLIALGAVKDLATFRRLLSANLKQKTYQPRA